MHRTGADLRVCFLAGCLNPGGAERQLWYMLRSLLPLGVHCQVLSLTNGEPYEERLRALGVPTIWVGQSRWKLWRLRRIVSEARRWHPDVIQCVHPFMNLYALVAARASGCIDIGAIRTDVVEEFGQMGLLGRYSLSRPTALIANSTQALETVKASGLAHKRLFFLRNAIDCDYFKPSYTWSVSPGDKDIWVLFVGHGHPYKQRQKRHDVFLRAFAHAKQSVPSLQARLVGPDMPAPNLVELASALGVQDSVDFLPAQSEMTPVYHSADIFVLTSDYEGTPNVILEAMACGLPVVSTSVGSASELVSDGQTGYLTPVQDVDAIAKRIVKLAENPALRRQMGKEARARVVAQHSLAMLGPRLWAIYDQVLGDT